MDGYPFVHRERVRFRDLDAMGHVNNAVYLDVPRGGPERVLLRLGAEVTSR